MEPLDGNSIAGALLDHYGMELTAARGACAHCGAVAQIAELRVYLRAPGSVARCRACGSVVMVVVEARSLVDMAGFVLDRPPTSAGERV